MKLFKALVLFLLFSMLFTLLGGCANKEINYDNYGIEVLYREDGYISKYVYQLIRREQKTALDLFGTHVGPVESSYTFLLPDGSLTGVIFESEEQTENYKALDFNLNKVDSKAISAEDTPKVPDLKYWMHQLKNEKIDNVADNVVEVDTIIQADDIYYCLIQYSDETSFLLEITTDGTVKSLIRLNMRTTSIALFEKE